MEFLEEFRFNNPTNNLMTGAIGIGEQRKKSSVIPTGHVGLRDIAKTEIWPFLYWSFLRLIKLIFMKSSKIIISFTLRLKILVIRKTLAYPTKRINKKRMSAKEALRSSVQNQSNISDHIVGQWLLGLNRPRQLPPDASGYYFGGSKSATRCPQRILLVADSITETE